MRSVVVSFAVMFLTACPAPTENSPLEMRDDLLKYTGYIKDPRTDECLIWSKTRSGYYVYVPVACTDKVLTEIGYMENKENRESFYGRQGR